VRDNAAMPRVIEGLLVDPVDGARLGRLTVEGERIASVEERPGDEEGAPIVMPGFVDLHVYDWAGSEAHGVTGYLATVGTSQRGAVERFLEELPDDGRCLGAHVEGPYLNPDSAGAQAAEHIRPVDEAELAGWLASGRVRIVTLAPEIPGAFAAIEQIGGAGAVPSIGHTASNHRTAWLAVDSGARFATHCWNAMTGVRARAPGAIGALLEDERVTLGLIGDGRHLHPTTEALTVRVAGPRRIALTSDMVPPPRELPNGKLLGGDRCGAAIVSRFAARFGLAEAAMMASLVPAGLLGLTDRGRLAPGFRADLAVLAHDFAPLETLVAGDSLWRRAEGPAAESDRAFALPDSRSSS
jgi:N-acetylglucosamine-6-phosphate deacetylase